MQNDECRMQNEESRDRGEGVRAWQVPPEICGCGRRSWAARGTSVIVAATGPRGSGDATADGAVRHVRRRAIPGGLSREVAGGVSEQDAVGAPGTGRDAVLV